MLKSDSDVWALGALSPILGLFSLHLKDDDTAFIYWKLFVIFLLFETDLMLLLLYEKYFFIWRIFDCVLKAQMIVFNVCMCLHEWDVSPVKGSCVSSLLVI